jgi:prepilin-type N-terminal cleavage/methylation domain-containing protein
MINRKGFTLIETLVAMMLLAISFVIIMQLFSGGLKSSRVTTDYIYGIFHAREKMEEVLHSAENLTMGMNGRQRFPCRRPRKKMIRLLRACRW